MVQYRNPGIALKRLVDEILPAAGIEDVRVLSAFRRVPRHRFVDEALALRAYEDVALPIGYGQTISQPSTVAYVAQALELQGNEKVLEIGSGSGYQTAILAHLAERIFAMERIRPLGNQVWPRLDRLGLSNVAIRIGDGTYGWPDQAPFDVVVVSAGSPRIPEHLVRQLRVGGKMIIPLEVDGSQRLIKVIKRSSGMDRIELDPCRFVKLVGRYGWEKSPSRRGKRNDALDS
ncbi:MAG: protein-L-isoaspartate(D-aspartate) O-methyltransferase [Deltaproteobacteria bacterium]|nr:protein-L-isoaspartate(D-aspartate) O-methyltransferase [Deltaproteobacteria bacterium]